MRSLEGDLAERAEVLGTGLVDEAAALVATSPDRVIVIGGDGSILAVARAMGDRQIPVIGVNFGKLGFLAEFSLEELGLHLDQALADEGIVSRRMMIEATIRRNGELPDRILAANDCVVHAGPPFRMVDLAIVLDGAALTGVSGDGLVLATPSGSTAHNMSAGGPIVEPVIRAITVTPMNPHSLTHRPLVVAGDSTIEVIARRVNPGTTVVIDGQRQVPLAEGDRMVVRRFAHDFQLVRNPAQPKWYTLMTKLKWGQ